MQTSTQPTTGSDRETLWTSGFRLGEWRVDPLLGRVEAAQGIHHVNPKAMEVLVHLASQPGVVCPKESVLAEVWPETFVTEAVLTSAVWELRKVLGDDARQPSYIETIPKRGYRLVAPVNDGAPEAVASVAVVEAPPDKRRPRWITVLGVAGILLAVAVGVVLLVELRRGVEPEVYVGEEVYIGEAAYVGEAESRIGLAVLPFANNTGDDQLDWLRRGIPDMLAFDLGRSSYLRVVSLEAVSGILGDRVDSQGQTLEAIGRVQDQTGARVVVTGRILVGEDTFRILAQVHDFETGTLRSEEVEGASSDQVLVLADRISRRIRLALEVEASEIPGAEEGLARTQTSSVEAYKSFVEGKQAIERLQFREAVADLQRAIELDSEFAHAYEALANAYDILGQKDLAQGAIGRAVETLDRLPRAEQLLILRRRAQLNDDTVAELEFLEQLVALRPRDAALRARLAWFQLVHRRDCRQSIVNYREAIELTPSPPPYFYAYLAEAHLCCSDPAAAREAVEEYARRMPDDVTTFHHRGHLFYLIGDYRLAASELERAIELQPSFPYSYGLLGQVRAAQGRYSEATALYEDALNRAAGPADREDALQGLAWLGLDRGDPEAAIDFARQALAIHLDSVSSIEILGLAEIARKRLGAAADATDRLVEILGRNDSRHEEESLHRLRGALKLSEGRADLAVAELEAALALGPMDQAPYWLDLANAQVAAGDPEAAERSFLRLFEVNPGYAPAHCAFADLLEQIGRSDSALAESRRCLEIWEGEDETPEWIQRAENRGGGPA